MNLPHRVSASALGRGSSAFRQLAVLVQSDSTLATLAAAATLLLTPTLTWAVPPQVVLNTVVLSGEPAPGGNGSFQAFSSPILNDLGQVAFHATLANTAGGEADDLGIYRGDTKSAPRQVIREGQVAPDGNGTFAISLASIGTAGFNQPSINSSGQVALRSFLNNTRGGTADGTGIYRWDGDNQLVSIARLGDELADHPVISSFRSENDDLPAFFRQPDLNDAGQVAFLSQFTPNNDATPLRGVLIGDGVSPIGLAAQTLQATPDGTDRLGRFVGASPVINNSAQAAINTDTENSGPGIFRGDSSGALVQVARIGQGIFGSDDTLGSFQNADDVIALNDAGQVAFASDANGNRTIFVSDGPGDLTQIVREGQAAPDGNGVFAGFFNTIPLVLLNDRGQVAFRSLLFGTSGPQPSSGVFLSDGEGSLLQVAREGQIAPGGEGVFSGLTSVQLNDSGQVAFEATIDATSGIADDYEGIYLHDPFQGLLEIAREGEAFLGSTFAGVSLFNASVNSIGIPAGTNRSSLNESGQIAFSFSLADGRRGVAIASIVPEPSALLLSIACCLVIKRQRRSTIRCHST